MNVSQKEGTKNMIRLRIYRTWDWVNMGHMLGDTNPSYELVKHDKLQFSYIWEGTEIWEDVSIVEEAKPEHPRAIKLRKQWEETYAWIQERLGSNVS